MLRRPLTLKSATKLARRSAAKGAALGDHPGYACDLWQGVWWKCHVWVLGFFCTCLTCYNFKKNWVKLEILLFFLFFTIYGDVTQISWDLLGPIQLWFYQVMFIYIYIWLVVSTPLKNISQLGWFFPIYRKIKNVPNLQPDIYIYYICVSRELYPEVFINPRGCFNVLRDLGFTPWPSTSLSELIWAMVFFLADFPLDKLSDTFIWTNWSNVVRPILTPFFSWSGS
jgi:hypothetical protein